MAFNPFHSFRRHQKGVFAALVIVAMITFVLSSGMGGGDIFNQITDWAGRGRKVPSQASLYGKELNGIQINDTQRQRQLADAYMNMATDLAQDRVRNAIFQERDRVDPVLSEQFNEYFMLQYTGNQLRPEQYQARLARNARGVEQAIRVINAGTATNKQDQVALATNFMFVLDQQVARISRKIHAPRESHFGGDVQSVEDTLDFLIWKKKANELNITLAKEDVAASVAFETFRNLTPEASKQIDEALKNNFRGFYTPEVLTESLMEEFRVRTAKATIEGVAPPHFTRTLPPVIPAPEELYEWYRDNRTSVTVGLIEVPVDSFLAKVTAKPTDAELRKLYDQHKSDEPNPQLERPGFKEPRKMKVDWLGVKEESGFYRKLADQAGPVFRALRHFAAASPDGSLFDAVLALHPVVSDAPMHNQFVRFESDSPKWMDGAAYSPRTAIHDSSVLRAESLAALAGASVSGAMTGAGAFFGPLMFEGQVSLQEVRDRARIGATAILAGAMDPVPLGIDALAMQLIPPSLTEAVLKPMLAERARDELGKSLVEADLTTFRTELAKRGKEQDANNAQAYANEFIHARQHERGGTAEVRDIHALAADPGLAPVRTIFERQFAFQIGPDPVGENFATVIAMGPSNPNNKPANFEPQSFMSGGRRYEIWRSEDRDAKVLTFEQAKPKVEAAWRLTKARELAKAEADKIAADAKAATGDPQKLRDIAAKTSAKTLIELAPLAKINAKPTAIAAGPTQYALPEIPRDRVSYPGNMADAVVDMRKVDVGATSVVTDQPKTNYYVMALIRKDVPSIDSFRVVYRNSMIPIGLRDPLLGYFISQKQIDFRRGLRDQLRNEAKMVVYNKKTQGGDDSE